MVIDLEYMPYYYELRDGDKHPSPMAHARFTGKSWANKLGVRLNTTGVTSVHMGSSYIISTSYIDDLQGYTPPTLTYLESKAIPVKLSIAIIEILEMLPTKEAQQAYLETVAKEQNGVHIS